MNTTIRAILSDFSRRADLVIARRNCHITAITVSATIAVLLAPFVAANPGDLDPSFGVNGKVTTDLAGPSAEGNAIAFQPDGKIVTAGSAEVLGVTCFALSRHFSNGTLDTAFGNLNGRSIIVFTDSSDKPYVAVAKAVAIQSDGKIVLGGYIEPLNEYPEGSHMQFALARVNADGSLDTSFGTMGEVTTSFGNSSDIALGIALDAYGKIVVVGATNPNPTFGKENFALARCYSNGSLDLSFGFRGKITTSFRSSTDRAFAVAIQSDGKIVAAGWSHGGVNGGLGDFALARYNLTGSLDQSFGIGGRVLTDFAGYDDFALAVAIQRDGKIVAAGGTYQFPTGYSAFTLARYNHDGSLDSGFGVSGKVTAAFNGSSDDIAQAVAIQANGKIVAAGYCVNGSSTDFAIQRFNCDGNLDATFGNGGKVQTAFGAGYNEAHGVAIQFDGKIVVAGTTYLPSHGRTEFALARYDVYYTIPFPFLEFRLFP